MSDAKTSPLLVERDGPVVTLINDDAPRNRMSLDYMDALEARLAELARDDSVRAIVITASESGSYAKIENGWRTRVADLGIEPTIGQP